MNNSDAAPTSYAPIDLLALPIRTTSPRGGGPAPDGDSRQNSPGSNRPLRAHICHLSCHFYTFHYNIFWADFCAEKRKSEQVAVYS
jgi:hypothetical protein